MADERLILITDSSGAPLKRWSVSMRALRRAAAVLLLTASLIIAALIHSVVLRSSANETHLLLTQNQKLITELERLQASSHQLDEIEWRLSALKSRLWRDSNLDARIPLQNYLTGLKSPSVTNKSNTRFVEELSRDFHIYERQAFSTLSHFRDTKVLLTNTPSLRPARSPWITSRFGPRRDPVTGRPAMHKGLDLGGYTGMPIIAPADGKVVYAGMRGGFGITIVIDHGFGVQTHYGHLSALHVEYGDLVKRGMMIAEMGSTGKSTGPHLHYEVRRWGLPLDPEPFMLN